MSLTTYKDSAINKVSKTIESYLEARQLQPGETVKYRLLGGQPQFNRETGKTDIIYGGPQAIPLKSSVIDPGDKDPENGKTTNAGVKIVGLLKEFDKNGNPIFQKLYVTPTKNNPEFLLSGDNADHIAMYDALELNERNASNPYRNKALEATFERVDDIAEGKQRSQKRSALRDSLNAIDGWNNEELKAVGAGYNISTSLNPGTIKDRLEAIAEADPKTFLANINKTSTKIKGLISIAKEKGVINFVAHENTWYFSASQEVILVCKREEGKSEIDQLCRFLESAANGAQIQKNITDLVKNKK